MYSDDDKATLLDVARRSILSGVQHHKPLELNPNDFSPTLQEPRATFVTLHLHGQLRGCIGSLEATDPLVTDVAKNAFSSALRDPRFDAVTNREAQDLDIEISVLSPKEVMDVASEEDLLQQLRPGVDGIVLEAGSHRGTFLPSVWEKLTDPRSFVAALKAKAGIKKSEWPSDIRVSRYHTQSISS